jgi:hypothetical protein
MQLKTEIHLCVHFGFCQDNIYFKFDIATLFKRTFFYGVVCLIIVKSRIRVRFGAKARHSASNYSEIFLQPENVRASQTKSGVIIPQPIASSSIPVVVGSASIAPSFAPL